MACGLQSRLSARHAIENDLRGLRHRLSQSRREHRARILPRASALRALPVKRRGSTGSTGMRWRMRCLACRDNAHKGSGRFTLKRHPNDYKRGVSCPSCGEKIRLQDCEADRRRELERQERCTCPSYPFPHRKGSMRFCDHHPRIDEEPTEHECFDYEACLATRRTG